MATWFREYSFRLLVGLLLLAIPIAYFVFSGVSWQPLEPLDHLVQNGTAYVLLVLFSYVNHTLFVPRWFLTKRYGLYTLTVISCILAIAFLPHRIEQWFFFKPPQQNTPTAWINQIFWEEMMHKTPSELAYRLPDAVLQAPPPNGAKVGTQRSPVDPFVARKGNLFAPPNGPGLAGKLIIFFLLGSVSTLLSLSIQTASRLRQVENDQLLAELGQLKTQIQPHFLFNTLNSIYALAIRQDAQTADTIVKLAEFMRYNIREAHRDKVDLRNEIEYVHNYIALQKARLREAVAIDYWLEGDAGTLRIAPLLLFCFIENAFKYGVSPEEESPIRIHIRIVSNQLTLDVVNNKVQINQLEKSTGIGLQNARERLRLLYANAHQLSIDDTPTRFQITLQITLL